MAQIENPKERHVGFTGTRNGMTDQQKATVELILKNLPEGDPVFHHGDCVGADDEFDQIARRVRPDCVIHTHPPNKPELRAHCSGRGPTTNHIPKGYLERDRDIVDASELLIGAPYQQNEPLGRRVGGTWYTIRYARKNVKDHLIVKPDGKVDGWA